MKILIVLITLLSGIANAGETITLTATNHVLLRNEVNDQTMTKLTKELSTLVSKRGSATYPIYLVLDSPGGSIDAGSMFIEYAKSVPNLQTITIFAASMAAGIVEALPGKRSILESGIIMFHRASGGVSGQFESGELESRLDLYKRIVRQMENTNAKRMDLSLSTYKSLVKDEFWILGEEAVSKNAADAVINIVCSEALINSSSSETFLAFGIFPVQVQFSKCPLLRGGEVLSKNMTSVYKRYRTEKYSVVGK